MRQNPRQGPAVLPRPDGIDVEFLGPFNLHFVAKNTVNYDGRRMISYSWSIPVIGVRLFPYSPVFQTNHGSASQSVESPVYAAYKKIELGARRDFRSFLGGGFFRDFSVSLQPG